MAPAELQRTWEQRLQRERLGVIDGTRVIELRGRSTEDQHVPLTAAELEENRAAVSVWQEWARAALTGVVVSRRQRDVWSRYAEGVSIYVIASELRLEQRQVSRAITSVKEMVPPSPVPNPWIQRAPGAREDDHHTTVIRLLNTSDRDVVTRVAALAIQAAPRDKLLELFGDDETLSRLVPQGDSMEPTSKKGPPEYMYDLITFRGILELPKRRSGGRSVDWLKNVQGRPHAGGIDVLVDTQEPGGEPTQTWVTVPWYAIKKAERPAVGA